jgi:hypothetical protein
MTHELRSIAWISISSALLLACPGDDGGVGTEGGSSSSSTTAPTTITGADDSSSGVVTASTSTTSSTGPTATDSTGDPSTTTSGSSGTTGDETTGGVVFDCTDPATAMYPGTMGAVDVLFVVDNSGTMGPGQVALGQAMDSLVARLDNEGLDYRIAVTTTDVGNPWCGTTSPEAGNFIASSCRSRVAEFVFNGAMVIDVSDEACLDVCPHDAIALEPTPTDLDPTPLPRPWIERINGVTNLPVGVTPAEALRCFVPQGIAGCGFESPLESTRRALLRAASADQNEYGFLRSGADLLVVLVSDEIDCSYDNDWETVFLPDGNRVFWSDPTAPAPTSAVCWNAGVACTGGPGMYDECHAENYDVDGNATVPANAVLYDLARYTDQLAAIDAANGPARVRVAVLAGVPLDYSDGGDLVYADAIDPAFQDNFGIGPGCETADISALPPERMREVAEAFADAGERNVYSLCSPGLCEAFERIVDDVVM